MALPIEPRCLMCLSLAVGLMILLFVSGCRNEQTEAKEQANSTASKRTNQQEKPGPLLANGTEQRAIYESPKSLKIEQVLIRGTIPMNSEFYDYNSDSKLDLFIGTSGHEYFPRDPLSIRMEGESYRRGLKDKKHSQQLSIHLNNTPSDGEGFQFGSTVGREWVNRLGWREHERTIPSG